MWPEDHRLAEAKAMAIGDVAERLGLDMLRRTGSEMIGPCPNCGGTDRFGINLQAGVFQCRRDCGPHCKGDQIALVQHVMGMEFRAALDWLCGRAEGLSEAERETRRRRAAETRRKQDEYARRRREDSIREARRIWSTCQPAEDSPVRDYLTLRGIDRARFPVIPPTIRFAPEARYTIPAEGQPGKWDIVHTGPAMVCAVVDAANYTTAVHRTWLDLSQPKGKLILPDPRKPGETLPAKKVLGSKKGAAIRFHIPQGCDTMVMGEGVETTLSALIAEDMPRRMAYWCGVDLGNMSGRMQRGPGLKYAGLPDLEDGEAWLPPDWVKRLIFILDGDSDPRLTPARLKAGLRRAMIRRPGLTGHIVHAGEGRDLNDLLASRPLSDEEHRCD